MKRSMFTFLIAALLLGALAVGCAAGGGGQRLVPPEEEVKAQLEQWRLAMKAQDIDAIMALFSEKFYHDDWRDKAGARAFIEGAIAAGFLDNIVLHLDEAQIKVDGSVASVYPVDVEGNFGAVHIELIVGRENGVWLLTGMDGSGL